MTIKSISSKGQIEEKSLSLRAKNTQVRKIKNSGLKYRSNELPKIICQKTLSLTVKLF